MRLTRFSMALAAIMGFSSLVGWPLLAQAQTAQPKVAIANPVRIFEQIQKTKDLRSQMETRTNALKEQQGMKANEIRDLQAKRDLLNKNSPEYAAIQKELIEKSVNLQAWMEITRRDVERTQKEQIQTLFAEIKAAITKVAEQKGIDIVIAEHAPKVPEDLETVTVDQLRGYLQQQNILYSKAVADITEAVILQMDADYKSGASR